MAEMNGELTPYKTEGLSEEDISDCINRIMNTLSFRKLSEKTQVILSLSGPDVRTRLTHTIEVSKIARDISTTLGLNDHLAEAIALAHDIGHTPFGHVGERTLREIMCGCDNLDGKVEDDDFSNSGFKHNLQSFRVLYSLEDLPADANNVWPYILWGAMDHTKMSYSEPYSGMDNEILISCKHCDWVYSCTFHEKNECKRNILKKRNTIEIDGLKKQRGFTENDNFREICKPWYCANLPVVETKADAESYGVLAGGATAELIEGQYIKKEYQLDIFCSQKCYMAKLWKHKIENQDDVASRYKYLFDHPFPNSFYAPYLNNYFYDEIDPNYEWCSLEAQVVKQADEIAQRQEDLEDGIRKGLITLNEAAEKFSALVDEINFKFGTKKALKDRISGASGPEEIGKLIVEFYSSLLVESTKYNFDKFKKSPEQNDKKLNAYCMLNLLIYMRNDVDTKRKWILRELKNISQNVTEKLNIKSNFLNRYFVIDVNKNNFLLIVYDYLDTLVQDKAYFVNEFDVEIEKTNNEIFIEYINILKLNKELELSQYEKFRNEKGRQFLKIKAYTDMLNIVRAHLEKQSQAHDSKETFDPCYDFFDEKNKKDKWKIQYLNLQQYYALYLIYTKYMKDNSTISCVDDLIILNENKILDGHKYNSSTYFNIWKKNNKNEANQLLSNIVNFVKDDSLKERSSNALKKFNKDTGKIILKSEIVEKNDGKATFILKRLFKAYIDDAHQLPDEGLKNLLFLLKENSDKYLSSEQVLLVSILQKLKKTLKNDELATKKVKEIIKKKDFHRIRKSTFDNLMEHSSNELKSFLDSRNKLYEFLKIYIFSDKYFKPKHKKDFLKASPDLQKVLIEFRRVMNNPILNATPVWKGLLSRGICDHIASLTDKEAINEYEKLYAGVMEIV